MALSTDFKDDILNESVNTKRKYNVIHNDDGTESYEDVTSYSQTGSQYGAKEVIEEREAINQLQNDVDALNSALTNKIDNLQWTKSAEYVNNFYMGGVSFFIIDSDVAHQIDLPDSSWWYVLHISKPDNTGFAVQFFIEWGGAGRVLRRWSSESAWVGKSW